MPPNSARWQGSVFRSPSGLTHSARPKTSAASTGTHGDLIADGTPATIGPGALDASTTFNADDWYHIYLIAKSAGSAPTFDAAVRISATQVAPDLADASLSGAGYDIWRRLGAVRTNTTPIFKLSILENGTTYYLDGENIAAKFTTDLTDNFTTGPTPISLVDVVPPTSRRATMVFGDFVSPSPASSLFVVPGDDARTTSGGRNVAVDTGSGGSQLNTFDVDLDTSQRARFRKVGGSAITPTEIELHAYIENP